MTDDKFEYFREIILKHLDDKEKEENQEHEKPLIIEKAGYPVGTIRTWRGAGGAERKYIKIAPGKWRRKYESNTRGAKMAIAALRRKAQGCKDSKELMQLVLENRERFSDSKGNPLPFVQELSKYVSKLNDSLETAPKVDADDTDKGVEKKPLKETPKKDVGNDIKEKYKSSMSIEGDEDEIYVGKDVIEGKWKLVEADAPSASHDETTFHKTKGFPTNKDGSTINDRDYEHDKAAQEAVLDISTDFDGRALSFDSPVIVTKDGIVVSGNNRTMSSKIAARKGTDKKYIKALEKRAKKFGFTKEQIENFKNPRVVFEIAKQDNTYSTKEFSKFNTSGKKAMSPVESAVKVSKTMSPEVIQAIATYINDYDTLGEMYSDKKTMTNIFSTLVNNEMLQKTDLPAFFTENGITGAGKEFLETVLIGSVIEEGNIRALNMDGTKSIRQKLVRGITPLIENKSMDGYSITKELNEAIAIAVEVARHRDQFTNVEEFGKQDNMFETIDPIALEFAKKMEGTQKQFAQFLQDINGGLKPSANGEIDIFIGEVESRDDILKRYINIKKSITELLNQIAEMEVYYENSI